MWEFRTVHETIYSEPDEESQGLAVVDSERYPMILPVFARTADNGLLKVIFDDSGRFGWIPSREYDAVFGPLSSMPEGVPIEDP